MELRHLRHFVAVAEELHFARAAERLGIEQSPLSHSIRNLEEELQIRLFHRTTRKTSLTRAGARFYSDAKRILNEVDAATTAVRSSDYDAPDRIRLALGEDLAGELFTRLLYDLEHHQPEIAVDVRELSHEEAARLVRDGGADVALTLNDRERSGLIQVRAWAEPLVLVGPLGHPLSERDQVRLGELTSESIALPATEVCPGYVSQVRALLDRHSVRIDKLVSVTHWNTAVSFASTGRSLALIPSSFAIGATSVFVVPIAQPDAELTTWLLHRQEISSAVSFVLGAAARIAADTSL